MTATTLEDLKTYIAGLSAFPVDRATQLFYGTSDYKGNVYVVISDISTDATYTTGGAGFYLSTFYVHSYHTSNAAALSLARQVDTYLTGQRITTRAVGCWLENLTVVDESSAGVTYRFHARNTYTLMEHA